MFEHLREKRNGSQGGFTLIEMAIVLIIIGLIIGAVLKGQDLITNARAKRVTNFMRQAEVAVWNHLDRTGYFPGDNPNDDPNGPDGDLDEGNAQFYDDIEEAGIENFEPTLNLGSSNFEVGVDMYTTTDGAVVPMLCIVRSDGGAWSEQEVVYAQMTDTSLDGISDSNLGKALGFNTCGGANARGVVGCSGLVANDWNTATVEGVCYLFDTGEES